jgi:hypothetical protein
MNAGLAFDPAEPRASRRPAERALSSPGMRMPSRRRYRAVVPTWAICALVLVLAVSGCRSEPIATASTPSTAATTPTPPDAGGCFLVPFTGLDVRCASQLQASGDTYQFSDVCRRFASCRLARGTCELVVLPAFEQCGACFDRCGARTPEDTRMQCFRSCEGRAHRGWPTESSQPAIDENGSAARDL